VCSFKKFIFLSDFEKRVRSMFMTFSSDHGIHLKHIVVEFISDKVNYCLGDKLEKKLGKVSIDRIWRNGRSIQDYYTNDFNFFIENGVGKIHKEEKEPSNKKIHKDGSGEGREGYG